MGFKVGSLGAESSQLGKVKRASWKANSHNCALQVAGTDLTATQLANLKVARQDTGSQGVNVRVEIDFTHLELAASMSGVFHALGTQSANGFKLSDLGGTQLVSNQCLESTGPRVKAMLDCKWLAELVVPLSNSKIFAGQLAILDFAHGTGEHPKAVWWEMSIHKHKWPSPGPSPNPKCPPASSVAEGIAKIASI